MPFPSSSRSAENPAELVESAVVIAGRVRFRIPPRRMSVRLSYLAQ